MKFTDRVLLVW